MMHYQGIAMVYDALPFNDYFCLLFIRSLMWNRK